MEGVGYPLGVPRTEGLDPALGDRPEAGSPQDGVNPNVQKLHGLPPAPVARAHNPWKDAPVTELHHRAKTDAAWEYDGHGYLWAYDDDLQTAPDKNALARLDRHRNLLAGEARAQEIRKMYRNEIADGRSGPGVKKQRRASRRLGHHPPGSRQAHANKRSKLDQVFNNRNVPFNNRSRSVVFILPYLLPPCEPGS